MKIPDTRWRMLQHNVLLSEVTKKGTKRWKEIARKIKDEHAWVHKETGE